MVVVRQAVEIFGICRAANRPYSHSRCKQERIRPARGRKRRVVEPREGQGKMAARGRQVTKAAESSE